MEKTLYIVRVLAWIQRAMHPLTMHLGTRSEDWYTHSGVVQYSSPRVIQISMTEGLGFTHSLGRVFGHINYCNAF